MENYDLYLFLKQNGRKIILDDFLTVFKETGNSSLRTSTIYGILSDVPHCSLSSLELVHGMQTCSIYSYPT